MTTDDYGPKIKAYQERADELRTIADGAVTDEARRVLIDCADDYERMASTIERIVATTRRRLKSDDKV
jgi:hypothetical protein